MTENLFEVKTRSTVDTRPAHRGTGFMRRATRSTKSATTSRKPPDCYFDDIVRLKLIQLCFDEVLVT